MPIEAATKAQREWAAQLMASTDPWRTLGRDLEQCREICSRPGYELFIDTRDGRPAGMLLLHPRGAMGSPYIATVAVAQEFRNQRVGTGLVRFAEDRYRERARFIFLCVSSFNTNAKRLYERLGYQQIAELKEYVIPGASEFLMSKCLR